MDEKDNLLDLSKFELLNKIGKGAFSKVFRVKEISSGEICAAKVLQSEINENTINSEEMILLLREVNLMSSLNHPSILGFVGFSLYNFHQKPFPTIITKLAQNGSLRDIINLEMSGLSPQGWDSTKKLINIYGIASGLYYLHMHDIIHRDMKPENILMDDYLFPKIADFGLSKITAPVSKSMNMQSHSGFKGTPIYMAPEIFRGDPYTNSVDVYSFSIIVYEIMTGITPFQNLNILQLMQKVAILNIRPKLTDDIPLPYQNLMNECWEPNPENRPTFEKIIYQLKNNKDFITDSINDDEYFEYIDLIDNYKTSFDLSHSVHFTDIINRNERNIKKSVQNEAPQKVVETEETNISIKDETTQKVIEKEEANISIQINFESPRIPKSEDIFYEPIDILDSYFFDIKGTFIADDVFQEDYCSDDDDFDDFLQDYYNEGIVRHSIVYKKGYYQKAICKIICPDLLKIDTEKSKLDQKSRQLNIVQDAFSLKKLDHPFVVQFLGLNLYNSWIIFDEEDDGIESTSNPTLFFEFPENQSIKSIIRENIELDPIQRQIIIIGIVSGLHYLHQKEFVHGCLCPEAIWLDNSFYPKIFPIERFLYPNLKSNINYQAPELLIDENREATIESDIFSFGRLLYYLITGSEPFKLKEDELRNSDTISLTSKICDGVIPLIPDYVSANLHKLLERCWSIDPLIRPSIKEIYYNLIFTKDYYINEIQSEEDFRRIEWFINEISFDRYFNELIISANHDTYVDIGDNSYTPADVDTNNKHKKQKKKHSSTKLFYKLDNIIHSNFTICSEEETLELLVKLAKYEFIQKDEKHLLNVIGYVNNLNSKGQKLAKKFLKIVFGKPINSIDQKKSLRELQLINISNNVVSINKRLFSGFENLVRINIPNSVNKIECEAFFNCPSLVFVNIPESIEGESIEKRAFKNCPKLSVIKTPFKLAKIADETFKDDESLSNVVLNIGLKIIGKEAFAGCNSIKYLKIPKSVTFIDDKAFYECKNLKAIIFEGNEPNFGENVMSPDVCIIYDN